MLKDKKTVALILAQMKPGGGKEMGEEESEMDDGEIADHQLQQIAQELIDAVKSGNATGVVEALRGAFLTFDSSPHVEGEHIEEVPEEEEPEEEGHEMEPQSHETRERFGGYKEKAYGGRAGYADGGMIGENMKSMYDQSKNKGIAQRILEAKRKNAAGAR
jgi:hypothetical protein